MELLIKEEKIKMNTLAKTSKKEVIEAAEHILLPEYKRKDLGGMTSDEYIKHLHTRNLKTVLVTATAEIIQIAKPECRFCPIALSVNRVLRPSYYALFTGSLWIIPRGRKDDGYQMLENYRLNSLREIMRKYDAGVLIQPFSFEITLPAEFLL